MAVNSIFVIGSGIMGNGIAQVAAQAGYQVWMQDLTPELVGKGLGVISRNLQKNVDKGKLAVEKMREILGNITTVTDLEKAGEADMVIEVATERWAIKEQIFKELDKRCRPDCIMASNTSSISITKIGAVTSRPEKVVGTHFFNPVPVMPIVELIAGLSTAEETMKAVEEMAQRMKKETVRAKDYPAFLLNRMLLPLLNEAFYCLMEGVGTREDIDKGMRLAMGHPMGPLTLSDFVGLDTLLSVFQVMYEGYGDPKYFPCPLLVQMVAAGHYGVKSGKGFYDYRK
ncbi:MAG: 3-hydroxybutyryl-CoA dehydrogenase [Firmicutes bacterium]|nr:3-hydroxybutyryl-CoA dehydrogenase [Bacillota bacterium]